MLLFIEGYPYKLDHKIREGLTIEDALGGVVSHFNKKEEYYRPEYVGYCYSKAAEDMVFFLPKVVLTGEQREDKTSDTIFGAEPTKIIDFEASDLEKNFSEGDSHKYKDFLSELSIWIYRTINVYKKDKDENILEPREIQSKSTGRKIKARTLLDVIIALREFNRHNQDFLTFIVKNVHSGFNKIHWTKTISKSQAIITNDAPVYLDPVNKKKVVNFDEELLVIYFSILNYVQEVHGFLFDININYTLIPTKVLKNKYIAKNFGSRRLRQIKYKYFSDKALRIWDLCYAFFDREHKISMQVPEDDYLLAKNFEHIFEVMIDKLVSGDDKNDLPSELMEQKDGKLVDHMYLDHGLLVKSDLEKELTYYIGDSKYYKRGQDGNTNVGEKSIYKQYTYARNVIQWNMNMFLEVPGVKRDSIQSQPQLRDDFTEGYNPIPNFFISAHIPDRRHCSEGKFLSFEDDALHNEQNIQLNRQFENRLFDRDTLLLCHYDVNFLFIVSLYGRDNKGRQAEWRNIVRKEFRKSIQETLNKLYTFYTLQPRAGMDCHGYIKENFHKLNGKIYRPQKDGNYLILALMKKEAEQVPKIFGKYTSDEIVNNDDLKKELEGYFYVDEIKELKEDLTIHGIPNVGSLEGGMIYSHENDLVLLVMKDGKNYDLAIQQLQKTQKVGVALKMDGAVLQLVEGFTKAKYLVIHNKGSKYNVYGFDGKGPKLVPATAAEPMVVTKQNEALYLVYQIDTRLKFYLGELDFAEATKGGEGYNPQLLPLSKIQKSMLNE